MADDKLKVIFDEQPLIPFSENDADYLKQFLISIIKNGLNNENITHMYFEQNGVESKKEKCKVRDCIFCMVCIPD